MRHPTDSPLDLPQSFGRYVLLDLLGAGGFARVYRAQLLGPTGFRKIVAVKIMRGPKPDPAHDLMREGRLGGLLKHRNVVDTYEMGFADSRAFVAMEWVDGLSLRELLQTAAPPPSVILELALGISRGLAYAHDLAGSDGSLGLVHLDLKPANVLVGWDGSVKVADFGIARLTAMTTGHRGESAGTPAYLSPEQAEQRPVDARSDVFSLGAVVSEIATGDRLFSNDPSLLGPARVAHMEATLAQGLAPLEARVPGLSAVVEGCVRVPIEERTPDAHTVSKQLRALQRAVGFEPSLEVWLADTLGEQEQKWVAELDSWSRESPHETLDFSVPVEQRFSEALAALNDSVDLTEAIETLHQAERVLQEVTIAERRQMAEPLSHALARAGLEVVASGNHPYLVFNPSTGDAFFGGKKVAWHRPGTLMGRLLCAIASHGHDWARERLYTEVWEQTYRPPSSDASLRMAVSRLRRQLKETGVQVERLGDGKYALVGRPGVSFWRGESLTEDGSLAPRSDIGHQPAPLLCTNLGPEPNAFIGRSEELDQLRDLLMAEGRQVTVLGAPGTGKTRFVKRFGGQQVEDGASVWFCDLTDTRSAIDVLTTCASVLGVPFTDEQGDEETLAAHIGHAIAGRGPCWLLLDNAEHVVKPVARSLRVWWTLAQEARFVVPSRAPLHIAFEQRLALAPLPVPTSNSAFETLQGNDAVALFVARAQALQASFDLHPENAEDLAVIVRELDGLPLAIELAASRVGMWPLSSLRKRLSDRFRLLTRPKIGFKRRQATLRGALDWSWALLTPWEQAALAQCSVFRGGFAWDAAEQVIDLSQWPQAPWVVDVLANLIEHSLLSTDPATDGRSRLSMLLSVAQYSAEKLMAMDAAVTERTNQHHGLHYAALGSTDYLTAIYRHGGVQRQIQLNLELENICIANERALASGHQEIATGTARAALQIIHSTGPAPVGISIATRVLAKVDSPLARCQLLSQLGRLQWSMGQIDTALQSYADAMEIARDLAEKGVEATLLVEIGSVRREQGRLEVAENSYTQALALGRELGDKTVMSIALTGLARVHRSNGRYEDARETFHQALAIDRQVGDRWGEAKLYHGLAILHSKCGQSESSIENYERALTLYRHIGDRRGEAAALGNLGLLRARINQRSEALSLYQQALTLHQAVGNRRLQARIFGAMGNLLSDGERLDDALEYYEQSLGLARELGSKDLEGAILAEIGMTLAEQGDVHRGLTHHVEAERILRKLNAKPQIVNLLCQRGHLELLDNNIAAARAQLIEVEAIAAELQVQPGSIHHQDIDALRKAIDEYKTCA